MKLNSQFFDLIAVKMIKEGDSVDIAKFILSGREALQSVQNYFYNLEAEKKVILQLEGDKWFLGEERTKALPLFKFFAASIIPFIQEFIIIKTSYEDYSFLNDIKELHQLMIETDDDEHIKIFEAFSNLQLVRWLKLNTNCLNLQLLGSLSFNFDMLEAEKFIFEAEPMSNKIFPTVFIHLHGNKDVKNDFVFNRQNYEKYAVFFPNAAALNFEFHMKVDEDLADFLKVTNAEYNKEPLEVNRRVGFKFYDYSGFPKSRVYEVIEHDDNWEVGSCPYGHAYYESRYIDVSCYFPLAHDDLDRRIAKNYTPQIPANNHGNPEDYYRLTITFGRNHEVEFEVLKSISVQTLLQAYASIIEVDPKEVRFHHNDTILNGHGIVGDLFENGDKIHCFDGGIDEIVF